MDLKTRYVIKGINKEQIVSSVVAIYLDGEGKIQKVQDKWDGKLPDGAIANVSIVSCATAIADFLIGFPSSQRCYRTKDDQCAQERQRGCGERKLSPLWLIECLSMFVQHTCIVMSCNMVLSSSE